MKTESQKQEEQKERKDFIEDIKAANVPGKKSKIKIALRAGGYEEQDATVYGSYGVNKSEEGEYEITHISSGLSATSADTMAEARIVAKALNKYFPNVDADTMSKEISTAMQKLIGFLHGDLSEMPDFIKEGIICC